MAVPQNRPGRKNRVRVGRRGRESKAEPWGRQSRGFLRLESGELQREGTKGVLGEGESKLEVRKQKLEMGGETEERFLAALEMTGRRGNDGRGE